MASQAQNSRGVINRHRLQSLLCINFSQTHIDPYNISKIYSKKYVNIFIFTTCQEIPSGTKSGAVK